MCEKLKNNPPPCLKGKEKLRIIIISKKYLSHQAIDINH